MPLWSSSSEGMWLRTRSEKLCFETDDQRQTETDQEQEVAVPASIGTRFVLALGALHLSQGEDKGNYEYDSEMM